MDDIFLVEPSHDLVKAALARVTEVSPAAGAILFGGDRWYPVEHVALAIGTRAGTDVGSQTISGMATLASTDEEGKDGPHIIGVWVDPLWRRQGIGTRLVMALARLSLAVYNRPATLLAVTSEGSALAQSLPASIPLVIRNIATGLSLPDSPSWLSLAEAGMRYAIRRDTLYRACKQGRCPAKLAGRSYLVNEYDPAFQAYIRRVTRRKRRQARRVGR